MKNTKNNYNPKSEIKLLKNELNKIEKSKKILIEQEKFIREISIPHLFLLFGIFLGFIFNLLANVIDYYFKTIGSYNFYSKIVLLLFIVTTIIFVKFSYDNYGEHFKILIKSKLADYKIKKTKKNIDQLEVFEKEVTNINNQRVNESFIEFLKIKYLNIRMLKFKILNKLIKWEI